MQNLSEAIYDYVRETRRLESLPSSTETSFYPDLKLLLNAALKSERLPFDVITGTSEGGGRRRDMPDFVLGDSSLFVGVYGEVKRADTSLADLAVSTEQNDQIGRYLSQTGVVLLCNVRGFGLLSCDPTFTREGGTPVPPKKRILEKTVDLWSTVSGSGAKQKVDPSAVEDLISIVTRAVADLARIASPADLAKILARQARDAKASMPDDLKPVKPLLDDYRQALGLAFAIDDEKGARFFRSSLVQSIFYALFAAWILWDKEAGATTSFDVEDAHQYLPIPFLDALLHDIRHPTRMKHLGLDAHLARAVKTFNRVDRPLFRSRMTFPTIDGETTIAAITYFYEPFLEAFDPQLREDLGVWYTPPEIVRYQVQRVHYLLKTELGRPRGLADPDVVVLDPCCGTGAYLLEVARCIASELKREGDESSLGLELARAFHERVMGFEILTAPFAIAQLQLYLLLDELGWRPDAAHRVAVFLTNALSGWHDLGDIKLNFPEMREEFDASQKVKREAKIIVILGNPPYDRFTGAAQAEEAELVAHYKGIELVDEANKDGSIKRDEFGRISKKQRGDSLLYKEFGVRKQLLDDLYIRFIRLAEERIGEAADYGVVSYISNSSYLTGRSHPLMRRSMLSNFHAVWIDNLNGDKYRTGKVIPKGLPGAGTRDDSAFTTEMDPRGIQPGTAIVTWVKRIDTRTKPGDTAVLYRDFWGPAALKRQGLLVARLQNVANPKLQRKLAELAAALDEDYEVSFELITTGALTEAALHDLEAFQQELAKLSEKENFDATIHVIDGDELRRRYDYALESDNPSINYTLNLAGSKYMFHEIAGTPVLIAAVPLKECIRLPGIKDGTLFQKNVRQSLGSSNAVNKGIRGTIIGDKRSDFFFFHNGITALCNKMQLDGDTLTLLGLTIVNGCQSLNTILSCSETVKKLDNAFILFRFYEIPQRDRADNISIFTNSQSAVKARDLRSNDKRVLAIKKAFELKYPSGFFITKRGQNAPSEKNKDQVVDLSNFAKNLIAWHSQRPNLSYGETKIFDKYFETLFKNKDYPPESVFALNAWMNEVMKAWVPINPLNLNESLLAMRAYAPFHHLYAVEKCFSIANNNQAENVASPSKSYEAASRAGMVDEIMKVAGISLNMALEAAANEPQPPNRVFSPQNWIKTKGCLAGINGAIRNYFNMLPMMPGGAEIKQKLIGATQLRPEDFEYRWSAD